MTAGTHEPIHYVKAVDVSEGRFWQVRDRRDERVIAEFIDLGYAKREADELNRLGVGGPADYLEVQVK